MYVNDDIKYFSWLHNISLYWGLFRPLSIFGYLGYFQFLVILNSTAMNILVPPALLICPNIPLGYVS